MRGILFTCCLAASLANADGYLDSARVVDVQPVTASERVPVLSEVCDVAPPAEPGDVRRQNPKASLGDLIAADTRRRRPQCREVTVYETRQKTVAWSVTYVYDGTTYVRRMNHKPGERIRVRVDLDSG